MTNSVIEFDYQGIDTKVLLMECFELSDVYIKCIIHIYIMNSIYSSIELSYNEYYYFEWYKDEKEKLNENKNFKQKNATIINALGDVIISNYIKGTTNNNKRSKSWQDNILINIIVGVIISIISGIILYFILGS